MMFSCVPYLLGYLLLSYAHYSQTATTFNVVLLAGRFITGLGMGWASASSPVSTFRATDYNNIYNICHHTTISKDLGTMSKCVKM